MNVIELINSDSVVKYLKETNYTFSTQEMAFIIGASKKISFEAKFIAWEELIRTTPDCPITCPNTGRRYPSLHAFLEDYIALIAEYGEDICCLDYSEEQMDLFVAFVKCWCPTPAPFEIGDILYDVTSCDKEPFVVLDLSYICGNKNRRKILPLERRGVAKHSGHERYQIANGSLWVGPGENYLNYEYYTGELSGKNRILSELSKRVKARRDKTELIKQSKFIAYALRHNPAAVGVTLDANGYAAADALIGGAQKIGKQLDMVTLKEIVATDEKGRYSFNNDGTKIRANYGHSVLVDLQLRMQTPPDVLYHGTAEIYLKSIRETGLIKKGRNFVYLSGDKETAQKVGTRHGNPIALEINAKLMVDDGYKFYLSENGIWLTDNVPSKYILGV